MPGIELYYKRRHELEVDKWDRCIAEANNGLIYSYSYYLDATADNWDAIVLNDYQAVMPLPWRKKYGVYYLYQPSFAAQLGVFGNEITAELFESFLTAIPSKFKLWELSFNHLNRFGLKDFQLSERVNYVLSLSEKYEILRRSYRENLKRNIKKSIEYGCHSRQDVSINQIIDLAKEQPNSPPRNEIEKFKTLFEFLKTRSAAKSYGVLSKNEELLASCVFTFSHNRAYYILVGNHPNGRTLGASHALIDAFIRDHAEQNLLLDFEGSDIRNLAFFYNSFGATEERYSSIRLNRLPWYIKWLKD